MSIIHIIYFATSGVAVTYLFLTNWPILLCIFALLLWLGALAEYFGWGEDDHGPY